MAKIAITGASGLIGSELSDKLTSLGYDVYKLVRKKPTQEKEIYFNYLENSDLNILNGFDVIINLAGENIAEGRWTSPKREKIYNSRIETTKYLVTCLNKLEHKPKLLISASAIGYYDNSKKDLTEKDLPGKTFLSKVCIDWEDEAKKFDNVAIARIGVVLSDKGGAVKKMLLPFSLGLGCFLGDGKQYMSCINLDDVVKGFIFLIEKNLTGEFNFVSPIPITNKEFSLNLAKRLKRNVYFYMPAFLIKLLFGKDFAEEMLLASFHVIPQNLIDHGFKFD